MMGFVGLVLAVNLALIATPADTCFGGVLTFEKITGFTSKGTSGSGLQVSTESSLDCLAACHKSDKCKALRKDYSTGKCYAYSDDTSTTVKRNLLTSQSGSNYFEKLCLMVNFTYFRSMCGHKNWAFERVPDAFLASTVAKSARVSSRAECARLCFVENSFACRSANYEPSSGACDLLRQDRRTQASAFRRQQGVGRDYLENQCSGRVLTTCSHSVVQNAIIAHSDHVTSAVSRQGCAAECDMTASFFCRSYSYSGNKCYLSADDSISAVMGPTPRQSVESGERSCLVLSCTTNQITYEKVTGRFASGAREELLAASGSFSSSSCLEACTSRGSQCPSLHVDYNAKKCYQLDRNTEGKQGVPLHSRQGTSYFEQICLVGAAHYCNGKAWAFERVPGYEMVPSATDRLLTAVRTRANCEDACLAAQEFVCLAAIYDSVSAECRLTQESRRTNPDLFRASRSTAVNYLENQCVQHSSSCRLDRRLDMVTLYPDVTNLGVSSDEDCRWACSAATQFTCRGAAFLPETNECHMSSSGMTSGHVGPLQGAVFFELQCSGHELVNGTAGVVSGPSEKLSMAPPQTPVIDGKCPPDSSHQQTYERITGWAASGGRLLYNSIAMGIAAECRRLCDSDVNCAAFYIDYNTAQCFAVPKGDTPTDLQSTTSASYFASTCLSVGPTCKQLWAFERLVNKELKGYDRETIYGISRTDCEERCLTEKRFVCRSATFAITSGRQTCRLSDQDQTTRPKALHDAVNSDYLQNECAPPPWKKGAIKTRNTDIGTEAQMPDCQFSFKREDRILNYNDGFTEVNNVGDCENACITQLNFNCRSYSYVSSGSSRGVCFMSSETHTSRGAVLTSYPGGIYGQLVCRTTGGDGGGGGGGTEPVPDAGTTCTDASQFTFERVMGKMPRSAVSAEIRLSEEGMKAPTPDCLRECKTLGDKCRAVVVHYSGGVPYQSPCSAYERAVGSSPSELANRADSAYFSKICLKGTKCDNLWTFERVPGYSLVGFVSKRLQNVATKEECMEKCLEEATCKSAQFYPRARMCHLSAETRRSQPFAFRFQGGDVQYLENQCAPDPSSCNFADVNGVFLPYSDRTLEDVASMADCRQECGQEKEFACRAVTFNPTAKTCGLSACDRSCNPSVRNSLIRKNGMTYSERSSCGIRRPFPGPQPMPPMRPMPPGPMFPIMRPPMPPPPMQPPPMQPQPPPPMVRFPIGVLQRAGRAINDSVESKQGFSDDDECVSVYFRVTGMMPESGERELMNVTSAPAVTTSQCTDECTRIGEQCTSFVENSSACFSFRELPPRLTRSDGVSFFRKACLRGQACAKLWVFDHLPNHELQGFDTHRIRGVDTMDLCAEKCLQEQSFSCRSAEFNAEQSQCVLSRESRWTRAGAFRQSSQVHYIENACVV